MEPAQHNEEMRAWLCLLRTPGLGPALLRAMLGVHGGRAREVLAQPVDTLCREHGLDAQARSWLKAPDDLRLDADLAWLAQPGHHLLRFVDDDFPPQLDSIDQPPAVLFVDGNPELLLRPQLAIVGARNASAQGIEDSRDFARRLAASGLVIASGLADGIDGAAHAAALDAGGSTLAVLGTGVDMVYPRKHHDLANRIAHEGALVSEFPLGTPAQAENFPRRNRIISGLSLGTLVIEAGLRSGSLITARLAAEQGREVFVLPGSIHNSRKRGCHRLIRDGARLVETFEEVVAALGPAARDLGMALAARLSDDERAPQTSSAAGAADPDYALLLQALGNDPVSLDTLAERSGLSVSALSSMLLLLELDGVVALLPGGRYQRVSGHACTVRA